MVSTQDKQHSTTVVKARNSRVSISEVDCKRLYYKLLNSEMKGVETRQLVVSPSDFFEDLILKAVSRMPGSFSTKAVFPKLDMTAAVNAQEFAYAVKTGMLMDDTQCNGFFNMLDEAKLGRIFGYQLFACIDYYRNRTLDGLCIYNLPFLPYKSRSVSLPTLVFTKLVRQLDRTGVANTKAWAISLDANVGEEEFCSLVTSLTDKQKAGLFKAFDIFGAGCVKFYHFLAVLQSYRRTFVAEEAHVKLRPRRLPIELTKKLA
jgi:hypothetical protein